jgi:Derlin-2/3
VGPPSASFRGFIPQGVVGPLHTFVVRLRVDSREQRIGCGSLLTDLKALAGGILNEYTFLPALSLAYAYTFAQDNPTRQVSFFIVNFDSKYLPFALLFMSFIIDGPNAALAQLTGLVAAHLYDFLTRIWPTFGGGKNFISTPQIVKGWFGAPPGSVQNRGYGSAFQGGGRASGAGAGAPLGRSTGNMWSSAGPGRRLGE